MCAHCEKPANHCFDEKPIFRQVLAGYLPQDQHYAIGKRIRDNNIPIRKSDTNGHSRIVRVAWVEYVFSHTNKWTEPHRRVKAKVEFGYTFNQIYLQLCKMDQLLSAVMLRQSVCLEGNLRVVHPFLLSGLTSN